MSICDNFEGALMKAIRSLEQHVDSLMSYDFSHLKGEELLEELKVVDDRRIWKIAEAIRQGISYAHGSYAPFFTRPISLILMIISVLCVFWPYISDHLKAKKAAKNPAPTAANVDVNDD